ncbi:MAG: hypothetical protein H0V40_00735 [Actinobacteria bacterium]|nr:hypothetical protein [Actinomycetota bacterium]
MLSVSLGGAGAATSSSSELGPVQLDRASLGGLFFSQRFARAEMVLMFNGAPHAIRFDRGRVQSTAGGTLTLLERDGTVVSVPVSPGAIVRVNGRLAPLGAVRRGAIALTVREGDRPAEAVHSVLR